MTSFYQQRLERQALVDWTTDDRFTHALTLNTDRELSAGRLSEIFSCFCRRFDKAVHGRNLNRVASGSRLHAIAFPENLSTNAHLHAVVDLSAAIEAFGDEALALERVRTCWLQATRGAGSICAEAKPNGGWGSYCTKRFTGIYFLAADYWPH
jgi:hypothetical protein